MKEYAKIMDKKNINPRDDDLFKEAVRYVAYCNLIDMRPPWLEATFSQALPGDGLLSQFTKPTFLQWSAETADDAFGQEVMKKLRQQGICRRPWC